MAERRVFTPQDFGATPDGPAPCTAALQAGIAAAAAAGGVLRLGTGVWRSGALFLQSGMALEIAEGATLRGSTDIADYPLIDTRVAGIEMPWPAALINLVGVQRCALRGAGTIDGDGAGFWAHYWALRAQYAPRGLRWASDYDAQRPRLVLMQDAQDVFVGGGLQLRRSGFWTLHLCYSRQVRVQDLDIRNNDDGRGPSTDGIDIDSSEHVLVRRVRIAVNDDAIAFKAGRDADGQRGARAPRDVLVADIDVHDGATGVAFGSETSGGFERVRVRRLRVRAPVPVGVLVKSARTRGGWARDLRLTDVRLDGVAVPLRITLDWNPAYSRAVLPPAEAANAPAHWHTLAAPVPAAEGLMRLHGLRLQRLHASGAHTAFEVDADALAPIGSLHLQHCAIAAAHGGHLLDVQAVHFEGCRLQLGTPVVLQRAGVAQGLPAALQTIAPDHPRRDVSALAPEVQDVQ
ncbi:glycoside hydrolase family 28 protein [Rubrivivax rivuli]|nr:glycosyl hydrolase family 28 protein [Rubrivivax rivuli]